MKGTIKNTREPKAREQHEAEGILEKDAKFVFLEAADRQRDRERGRERQRDRERTQRWALANLSESCLRRDFPISFLNISFIIIFHAFFGLCFCSLFFSLFTPCINQMRLRVRLKRTARTQHITLAELWYGCEERTLLYFWQSLSKFYESSLCPAHERGIIKSRGVHCRLESGPRSLEEDRRLHCQPQSPLSLALSFLL